jgi:hypothetical protein
MSTASMARLAATVGEQFVYRTFTEGARDAYEDVGYTADPNPPTIRGIRSDSGNRTVVTQAGEERKVDIAILVAYPLKNSKGNVVTLQDDMTQRAATLTDSAGRIYKMVGLGHEAGTPVGAKRIMCVRQAT